MGQKTVIFILFNACVAWALWQRLRCVVSSRVSRILHTFFVVFLLFTHTSPLVWAVQTARLWASGGLVAVRGPFKIDGGILPPDLALPLWLTTIGAGAILWWLAIGMFRGHARARAVLVAWMPAVYLVDSYLVYLQMVVRPGKVAMNTWAAFLFSQAFWAIIVGWVYVWMFLFYRSRKSDVFFSDSGQQDSQTAAVVAERPQTVAQHLARPLGPPQLLDENASGFARLFVVWTVCSLVAIGAQLDVIRGADFRHWLLFVGPPLMACVFSLSPQSTRDRIIANVFLTLIGFGFAIAHFPRLFPDLGGVAPDLSPAQNRALTWYCVIYLSYLACVLPLHLFCGSLRQHKAGRPARFSRPTCYLGLFTALLFFPGIISQFTRFFHVLPVFR